MMVNRGSYPKEVLERTYVYSSKKYGYVVELKWVEIDGQRVGVEGE